MEIERKFLINGFPQNLELLTERIIKQSYLTTDPEVRVRESDGWPPKLTVKGTGSLCRREVETIIDQNSYDEICRIIARLPIYKDYKAYKYGNLTIECSRVDPGAPTEFYYAEVEFETEEDAMAFIPLDFMVKEVTYDSKYKMKNYWRETRL